MMMSDVKLPASYNIYNVAHTMLSSQSYFLKMYLQ